MKPEDKQLLVMDLCARLPYGTMIQAKEWVTVDAELKFGHIDRLIYDELKLKPYLRPLSSMTEEEKEEMYHDCYIVSIDFDRRTTDMVAVPNSTKIVDWLNAHQFDYRGLIEKGLALEAPKCMYK